MRRCRSATDAGRVLGEQKQVTVTLELEPTEIEADADRLATLVSNLLSNAIRYNKPNGRVTVSLKREEAVLCLRVADTGIGIPEEDQPQVFERFHRVDTARTRDEGGSGLGLAICQEIVKAHKGSIELASKPGEGSTFTVRLPCGYRKLAV